MVRPRLNQRRVSIASRVASSSSGRRMARFLRARSSRSFIDLRAMLADSHPPSQEARDAGRMRRRVKRKGLESIAPAVIRSEEHTSELQSLMRISYAVFCLKKKKNTDNTKSRTTKK